MLGDNGIHIMKKYCVFFYFYSFLQLWDAINGGELHSFSHPHIVKSVDFNSDDSKLLTGANDKKVRIFDLHRPEESKYINILNVKNICWNLLKFSSQIHIFKF